MMLLDYIQISAKDFQTTVLQFVLLTIVGSVFTALLRLARDRRTRRESIDDAIRELIRQVDDLYRSSKQIKRALRSRITEESPDWAIPSSFFEAQMDELSRVQLSLERCWQDIRTRMDLFSLDRQKRIRHEIRYAERYLHDVVEEFEKRNARQVGENHVIDDNCPMLRDFLGPRWIPTTYDADFKKMDDGATAELRHAALQRIRGKQDGDEDEANNDDLDESTRRYKPIADECLLLVLREMRESMMNVSGRRAGARRKQRVSEPIGQPELTAARALISPLSLGILCLLIVAAETYARLWLPLSVSATKVFVWVPILFFLYLGIRLVLNSVDGNQRNGTER